MNIRRTLPVPEEEPVKEPRQPARRRTIRERIDHCEETTVVVEVVTSRNEVGELTERTQFLGTIKGRSQISIATGGRVFLEENLGGSSKSEARAGAVVE